MPISTAQLLLNEPSESARRLLWHVLSLGVVSRDEPERHEGFDKPGGIFAAGALFAAMGGSYPKVGATCGLIYLLGLVVIWWAPDTADKKLEA